MKPEPFRIKMVESINLTDKKDRQEKIKKAGYNVFQLKIEDIFIDLLTDSGTSAMSDQQWAQMLTARQAYAGTNSYYQLKKAVDDLFGFKYFLPVHQGRAAEHLLFSNLVKKGQFVPNNCHFDTTEANVQFIGGIPKNFMVEQAMKTDTSYPFKGNMNIKTLESFIKKNRSQIPLVMSTITNNTVGGQAVSLENLIQTSRLCQKYKIPFYLDACRFAENAYLIKQREPKYRQKSISWIIKKTFSLADGCTFSAKKDGLVNIGGLIATNSLSLFRKLQTMLVVTEGFPTYGGMACRELSAMAVGLQESTRESYLVYRHQQVNYLFEKLKKANLPVVSPVGGHAVFINGLKFFPHIKQENFPSQTLAVELYLQSGIRAVELGTSCFGRLDTLTKKLILPKLDLLRLTIPRRVYTNNQLDYVAESIIKIFENQKKIKGLKRVYAPKLLGHFLARFDRL